MNLSERNWNINMYFQFQYYGFYPNLAKIFMLQFCNCLCSICSLRLMTQPRYTGRKTFQDFGIVFPQTKKLILEYQKRSAFRPSVCIFDILGQFKDINLKLGTSVVSNKTHFYGIYHVSTFYHLNISASFVFKS